MNTKPPGEDEAGPEKSEDDTPESPTPVSKPPLPPNAPGGRARSLYRQGERPKLRQPDEDGISLGEAGDDESVMELTQSFVVA